MLYLLIATLIVRDLLISDFYSRQPMAMAILVALDSYISYYKHTINYKILSKLGLTLIVILLKSARIGLHTISIGPIPAYFDGIGIGQVHYTSTNFVACAILSVK